jgi:serine/threonine protein kinase
LSFFLLLAFGEVFEGIQSNGQTKVAFKLISMQLVESKHAMKYLLQEIQIMRDLSMYAHPNVVRLLIDHREADMHYLVLEHCAIDFGTLLVGFLGSFSIFLSNYSVQLCFSLLVLFTRAYFVLHSMAFSARVFTL